MCVFTQSIHKRVRSRAFTGSLELCVRPAKPIICVSTPLSFMARYNANACVGGTRKSSMFVITSVGVRIFVAYVMGDCSRYAFCRPSVQGDPPRPYPQVRL